MDMPFVLSLFDEQDNIVTTGMRSPAIPAVGTQLIIHMLASSKFCWEVTAVQLHFADPASRAARGGEPMMVELRVKPGSGIHEPWQESPDPAASR